MKQTTECLDCKLVGLKRLGLYENKYGNLVCDFHLSNPVTIREVILSK